METLPINQIIHGDSKDILVDIPSNSIDLIVTDPPYFIINKSGKGFLNHEWDSVNNLWRCLWKKDIFVDFVEKFFISILAEKNGEEENFVQGNVKQKQEQNPLLKIDNAPSAIATLEHQEMERRRKDFALLLVFTKQSVLDLLKSNHINPIKEKFLCGVSDNAKFVMPLSLLEINFKNIVAENALKYLIKRGCGAETIQLSLMDVVKISVAIGGITGMKYDIKSMREIIGLANYAEKNATKKTFTATILSHTNKEELMKHLTLLLYALFATQRQNITHNSLIDEFYENTWEQSLRVLKPGAFAFIFCIPRADCMYRMIQSLENAGFNVGFTPLFWAFASGMPKAISIERKILKDITTELKTKYNLNKIEWEDA